MDTKRRPSLIYPDYCFRLCFFCLFRLFPVPRLQLMTHVLALHPRFGEV